VAAREDRDDKDALQIGKSTPNDFSGVSWGKDCPQDGSEDDALDPGAPEGRVDPLPPFEWSGGEIQHSARRGGEPLTPYRQRMLGRAAVILDGLRVGKSVLELQNELGLTRAQLTTSMKHIQRFLEADHSEVSARVMRHGAKNGK
jgi:hypothetical protein